MSVSHADAGAQYRAPSGRPTVLSVAADGIPKCLLRDPRWVVWRLEPKPKKPGEWTKEPYQAADPTTHASSTNPKTWATFDAAFMAYQTSQVLDGVGYNLEGSGIVGLDLDDAIDEDGRIKSWAREIVDAFPGYWERSPLGRGLRGLAIGTLPPGRRKTKYHGCTVEMYAAGRYLTITGQVLRAVDELPEPQDAIEAVHARIFGGDALPDAGVVTTMTGAAETVPVEYMPVLEAVLGGKYAEQMARVWDGNYDDFNGDESNGEWALAREITFHAMALGFEGDELARIAEALMRAGPYRDKWDTPRTFTRDEKIVHTTWLGRTIGRAIESRTRKNPVLALDFDDEPPSDAPTDEPPAQIIARLQRELAKERAVVAAQQTVIRTLRAELECEHELRAKDRRLALAVQQLRRCRSLPASQTDAIEVVARIAPPIANSHRTESPIITRKMVAEEMGTHEATAGAALKVFDHPNSPIRRKERRLSPTRKIVEYELATHDPAEIIERMVTIVRAGDDRPKRRGPGLRCPSHPDAGVVVQTACAECGLVLATRESGPPGDGAAQCEQNTRIGGDPPTVDVSVSSREQFARIDEDGLDEVTLARRAREALDIPMGRAPDKYKQPVAPEPEAANLGPIKVTRRDLDPSPPWRHDRCGSLERYTDSEGRERCEGCTELLASSEVAS